MQRAFSARLSAAAKRAPIARSSGFNLQQQRFAHKVRFFEKLAVQLMAHNRAIFVFRSSRSFLW